MSKSRGTRRPPGRALEVAPQGVAPSGLEPRARAKAPTKPAGKSKTPAKSRAAAKRAPRPEPCGLAADTLPPIPRDHAPPAPPAALPEAAPDPPLAVECDKEADPDPGSHLGSDASDSGFVLGDPTSLLSDWSPDLQAAQADEPLCVFAPFDAPAADDDEPPFDAPDEDDLHDISENDDDWLVELRAPPPTNEEPPPQTARSDQGPAAESAASRQEYLTRARKAAQEQAQASQSKKRFGLERLQQNPVAVSVTAGLAMPLLLAGVWAVTAPTHNATAANPIVRAAALGPTTASASDHTAQRADYDEALRHLADGRTRAAIPLLRRAAERGHVMGQYRLAKLYERGDGVPRNLTTAREWAERAARAGNCRAMHDVGVYFAQGEGAPRDEAAAFRWFREAAAFGVADSQYNLGILYQQGRGVRADAQEALFWFLVAAHHGETDAADRAVDIAVGMSALSVAQTRARARAFQARVPDAVANGSPAAA